MKRYLIVSVLALGCVVCFASLISLAQEEEELECAWGTARKVSSKQIVVTEYNSDTYEDIDATYTIDPKAALKNAESLKDIKVGDSVEIDYIAKEDEGIAKIISVEKPAYEEEYIPSETYEQEPDYSSEEIEY